MKENYTPFGAYFSNLRKERKQSIAEAAKLLGVSISYISSVEHGNREIPIGWISKIISVYNLDSTEQEKINSAFYNTSSVKKVSLSEIEWALTNMINNLCEGEVKEKLLDNLKDRLNEFRK